jgi:hypothetical protein
MEWPTLLALAITALALLYVKQRWRPPADFVIAVRSGQVECRGALPRVLRPELESLLLEELKLTGPVTINGKRFRNGLRLWFDGRWPAGHQQRVRNFLLSRR